MEADDQNKIVDQKRCACRVFVSKQKDISTNDYAHIMPIYEEPLIERPTFVKMYRHYPLFYSVNIGIVSSSCHLYTLYQENDLRQKATFAVC